jgi:hypothetical protein
MNTLPPKSQAILIRTIDKLSGNYLHGARSREDGTVLLTEDEARVVLHFAIRSEVLESCLPRRAKTEAQKEDEEEPDGVRAYDGALERILASR